MATRSTRREVGLLGCAALAAAMASPTMAQTSGMGVFADALRDGLSTSVVEGPRFDGMVKALQQQSGSTAPIVLKVTRVARFAQQSRCGRVAYELTQPTTGRTWPQYAAQLNVCEDGTPPWRTCGGMFETLVPPATRCPDGSVAKETAEVAAAQRAAIAAGGIEPEEARKRILAARERAAAAPATPAASRARP